MFRQLFKFQAFCIGLYKVKYDLNLVVSTNKDKMNFLMATTPIYANGAGIIMAAGTRLTLQ